MEVRSRKLEARSWKLVLLTHLLTYSLTHLLYAEVKKDATTKASPKYEEKKSTVSVFEVKKSSQTVEAEKPKIDKRTNVQKLKDENWLVRRNAAISLGTEKNKNAVLPLIALLKDQNTEVRRCAAVSLGEIGDKQAVPHLLKSLNDADGGMIIDSASSIAKFKDETSIPPLKKLLTDGRPVIRITALKSLMVFSDKPDVQSVIVERLNDEAEGVRLTAIQSVSSMKLKSAVANLIKNLSDVNPTVRTESAKALGEIGDKSAIEPLKKAIEVKDDATLNLEVVGAVKQAIEKLESKKNKKQ
ncbi:MAG: HEAT repeat domain-containing protein [Elusimicrobia bacterium]|nr:HEAT repeat domain-containing protein [Elusimicrobiota bacterium]